MYNRTGKTRTKVKGPEARSPMMVKPTSRVTRHRPSNNRPKAPQSRSSMRVPVTKPTRTKSSSRNSRPSAATKTSAAGATKGPTTDSAGHLISNLQQQVCIIDYT